MTNHADQVILHVSGNAEDVPRAFAAAEALTISDPELHIRIIVNGAALNGATTTAEQISPSAGTTLEVCELGLQRHAIPAGALQPVALTVPSAIVAIVEAQLNGATYVRI